MSILDSNRKTKIDLYYAYFGYQRQPKVGSTRNHSSINDGDIVPHCKIDLEELYTDVYDKSILNYLIPTTYSLFLVIYMLKLDKNTYDKYLKTSTRFKHHKFFNDLFDKYPEYYGILSIQKVEEE